MAVYTKLTKEEISEHLRQYDLGELVDFKEILSGIDNSNFILQTSAGKYILTIFEKRIKESDLPFFVNFVWHLAKNNLPVATPAICKSGEIIASIKNKKSIIANFLNGGEVKEIKAAHCFALGEILAKMHLAALDFEGKRENDLGVFSFRNLFAKFENLIDDYQIGLKEEIAADIEFLENNWKSNLPAAATHLDLFPDNVFFDEKNSLCGVIDFYFAANDLLIYDFGITMVAWCDSEEKFMNFLNGYEKFRKLSEAEKDFLKIALVAACMRFLLTRLHDMFFTDANSFVTIKNPQEYLQKLRFFKNNL
jgi:homoserine kinase type II